MFKDEILENENRSRIYKAIEANPGIHLREIQRILDMPLTTLDYHLNYMLRKNVLIGERKRTSTKYYAKPFDGKDKQIFSALRQKRMRDIVFLVLMNRKAGFKVLTDQLKLPRSTLSFYLKYLVENNILSKDKVGYESIFRINDEDRVIKILIAYKPNFVDRLVDKALNTWMETQLRQEKVELK